MTYIFPESLNTLRKYLKGHGFEGSSIKTSRQAAFVAQQLLGARFKFPPIGQDMTKVLIALQNAVPVKGIAIMATPQRYGHDDHTLRDVRDTHTPKAKKPDQRSKKAVAKRKREALQKTFAPETFATGVHIFCDGCCEPNPGEGGWGVAVYRDGEEIESFSGGDADTTNNAMELEAMLNAIRAVCGRGATIWCDSQYVVKGCNEWRHGWKKNGWQRGSDKAEPKNRVLANADLWKAIDEALSSFGPTLGESVRNSAHISIRWVKGHAGVAGNERADELAEMGRQETIDTARAGSMDTEDLDERYRQIMGAA